LPESIESVIATTEQRAKVLKIAGRALLIECRDAAITGFIANHESTKNFCLHSVDVHLTVKVESKAQFRRASHRLGWRLFFRLQRAYNIAKDVDTSLHDIIDQFSNMEMEMEKAIEYVNPL